MSDFNSIIPAVNPAFLTVGADNSDNITNNIIGGIDKFSIGTIRILLEIKIFYISKVRMEIQKANKKAESLLQRSGSQNKHIEYYLTSNIFLTSEKSPEVIL